METEMFYVNIRYIEKMKLFVYVYEIDKFQ